jgi:type II secretory pathway component PulF
MTQLLIFLLNKKSQNHVNGLGFGFMFLFFFYFLFLKKVDNYDKKKKACLVESALLNSLRPKIKFLPISQTKNGNG